MSHDCISPCVRTGTCVVCGHRSDVGDDWCLAFSSSTRTRTCSACQRVNECTQSYVNVCRFFLYKAVVLVVGSVVRPVGIRCSIVLCQLSSVQQSSLFTSTDRLYVLCSVLRALCDLTC